MIAAAKAEIQELDKLIPLKDAAEYVDITEGSIRMVILRGNLYGVKIRGVWHVTLRDLFKYVESRPTRVSRVKRDWAKVRPLPPQPIDVTDRDWAMFRRYILTEETFDEVGKMYGDLTAQRVQVICGRVSDLLHKEVESLNRGQG